EVERTLDARRGHVDRERLTHKRHWRSRNPATQQSPAFAEVCYSFYRKHGRLRFETARVHDAARRPGPLAPRLGSRANGLPLLSSGAVRAGPWSIDNRGIIKIQRDRPYSQFTLNVARQPRGFCVMTLTAAPNMEHPAKAKVFISYSRKDMTFADR